MLNKLMFKRLNMCSRKHIPTHTRLHTHFWFEIINFIAFGAAKHNMNPENYIYSFEFCEQPSWCLHL